MNCKPGDLAIVVKPGPWAGRLLEVLYAAPDAPFTLPNGIPHQRPLNQPAWVVNVLGSPISASNSIGGTDLVMQGVASDKWLRPLRGDLEDEFVEKEATV